MEIAGRTIVVTGGGNGIGAALARRFAADGARGVVVADLDGGAASMVAAEIDGLAVAIDMSDEAAVQDLVSTTEDRFGPIDLFCQTPASDRPAASRCPTKHGKRYGTSI